MDERKLMKLLLILLLLPLISLHLGCTQNEQFAVGGVAAGSAVGAIIGHQHSSSHRDKGVLIGAAVGAIAGIAVGQAKELERVKNGEQLIAVCPSCESKVDVTDLPMHSTVECPGCRTKFTY